MKSVRLEITCGEGPYLASRYDAPTGEIIPVCNRAGILDRKLRVIGENVDNEADWLKWAKRAFQSVYGFEYQGDSLLIARVNALMTFAEHFSERWGHLPKPHEYHEVADIIAWNIWEMDGLSGTVPYRTVEKYPQMLIDGWIVRAMSLSETPKHCVIYDWRRHCEVEYLSLKEKGAGSMKFDYIIGNPPYQDETLGDNKGYAPPIYHRFMDGCYEVSDRVELIHPARFLFNAGSTPKAWNQKMLQDPHLKVLHYEHDASTVFNNTEIKGGVAITFHDKTKDFGSITIFTPYDELNRIIQKISQTPSVVSFSSIVVTSYAYHFTEKMHEDNPNAELQLSKGHAYDLKSNVFERLPNVFLDELPNDGNSYIRILGRLGNERVFKYIRAEYINEVSNLHKFKIFIPKANGVGALGEVLSPPVISEPGDGATETFLSIGAFDTKIEAEYALKYIKTKFARILLGVLKTTQDITPQKWNYVPLQNFTPDSNIDWSLSVPDIDCLLDLLQNLKNAQDTHRHTKSDIRTFNIENCAGK